MIPLNLNNDNGIEMETASQQPGLTFRIVDNEAIVGKIDELDAIKQAITIMLSVERYDYPIYSWQYGAELSDLIGKDISYVCPVAAKRIKECLLTDARITGVDSWVFNKAGNVVTVEFTVHTIYGDVNAKKEVVI